MKKSLFFNLCLFITSCHIAPAPTGRSASPIVLPSSGTTTIGSTGTPNQAGSANAPSGLENPNAPNSRVRAATRTNELPYNLTPDFMTSLTCSNNINFGSGYYTLSISSYYEGLQLADPFKRVNGLDDNNGDRRSRIIHALNNSPLNRVRVELSVRSRANIYSIFKTNSNPIKGFFPGLNTNYILTQLSINDRVLSTRPVNNSRYNSAPFRTYIGHLKNQDFVRTVAPNLVQSFGDYMLALVYTSLIQGQQDIPISDSDQRPYGKSYTLDFNSSVNVDYLTNVYEENLQSTRRGQDWTCPSDLRFMIHKNENDTNSQYNRDAANRYSHLGLENIELEGYCDINDRRSLTTRQEGFLSLEFGENQGSWPFKVGSTMVARDGDYVKLNTPCIIIPRGRGSCYNPSGFYRIEFDTDWLHSCKRIHDFSDSDRDYNNVQSAGVYRVCPAWLSMCYRNPTRN